MFKYEMHAHCSEVSKCGMSTAVEMVKAYAGAGFSGIVFTDHFIHGNTAVSRKLAWKERMQAYFLPFNEAKKLADEIGITVIIGLEHAYGNGKEVLVYGDISAEILSSYPEIEGMKIEEFIDFCHKQGWFVAQAHPFRQRDYINMSIPPIPELVDGIEIYNYCNNSEENIKAAELCEKHGLIPISGSDTHNASMCGHAGLAFDKPIKNGNELAKALFEGSGRLIIDGKIDF